MKHRVPSALFSADERALPMFRAYARVLAHHEPFVSSFASLISELARVQSPKALSQLLDDPNEPARQLMNEFITQWRLGDEFGEEYGDFARNARGDTSQAQPLADFLGVELPPGARLAVPLKEMNSVEIEVVPPVRWTFTYELHQLSPAQARRIIDEKLKDLRKEALAKLEAVEAQWQAAGYEPLPPSAHNDEVLSESARRLFERAVLGKSWGQIASRAGVSVSAVRESVELWATTLGVHFPEVLS